jgi:hypothetical protein
MEKCLSEKEVQEFEQMLNTPTNYVVYKLAFLKKGTEKYTLFNNQGQELFALTKTDVLPQIAQKQGMRERSCKIERNGKTVAYAAWQDDGAFAVCNKPAAKGLCEIYATLRKLYSWQTLTRDLFERPTFELHYIPQTASVLKKLKQNLVRTK